MSISKMCPISANGSSSSSHSKMIFYFWRMVRPKWVSHAWLVRSSNELKEKPKWSKKWLLRLSIKMSKRLDIQDSRLLKRTFTNSI